MPARSTTITAALNETIKEAVDRLPADGGTILLSPGVYLSGFSAGTWINKPHVAIQGAGIASYNSTFTAMQGGTVIQGTLPVSTGADYFVIRNLGVDAGAAYVDMVGGNGAVDALSIFNAGQAVGARPLMYPVVENVSCLGYSPTAAVHCMLVENVDHAYVHNVVTALNCHGLVLKGINSTVDGVYSRGHGIDSIIVKSDDYAPSSNDTLKNITIASLTSPGDTKGIFLLGQAAPLSHIAVSDVLIHSPLSWGVNVQGDASANSVTSLNFTNIKIDYPGASPPGEYCMEFTQYVSDVSIDGLSCSDLWEGIAPYLPVAGSFDSFKLANSSFTNIAVDGMVTFGNWNVSNTSFRSIRQNGIVNLFGITTISSDTFNDIGGSDLLPAGGSFQ